VARYKQQVPPFKETQNYVKTVMQLYAAFRPDGALVADAQPAPGVSGARRQGQRVRMQLGAAARPETRAEARLDTQAARSNPDS
jgi:hypothetical protein